MRPITRDMVRAAMLQASQQLDFSAWPIQTGLGKCPWRVGVASMLLQRTTRVAMQPVLEELLQSYPTHVALAAAGDLERRLQPLGLYRVRARSLVRFSEAVFDGAYSDVSDLPGVGPYVCEAIGLYVFGFTDVSVADGPLQDYARRLRSKT